VSAPASPTYFAALTLAIVTLRSARTNAELMNDKQLCLDCGEEIARLEQKRDGVVFELQRVGGA
jgi:hypothetical protein